MRRLLLSGMAVAGLTVPLATVVMAPAAHANAGIQCNKIKGSAAGSVTVSNCAPEPKTAKKTHKMLVAASALTLGTGGTLTWNGGSTVTISAPTLTTYGGAGNPPIPAGVCPKSGSLSYWVASATVTAGDGVVAITGDTFSANICADKKGKFYLSPSSKIQI